VGTRSKTGIACCGLVIVMTAACGGGGDRWTAARYLRTANGICLRANREVGSVSIPLPLDRNAARAMAHVVAIQRASIDDLRNLRPPARLGSLNQRWIALLDQATDELERMSHTLQAGQRAEADEYRGKASTLLARARALVKPHGVTSYRGPELPST
jgi:hypothetical protein